MRQLLTRDLLKIRWLRLALIVLVTYFVGSAIIAPHLNPLIRGQNFADLETQSVLSAGWVEMALTREALEYHWQKHQQWPDSIDEVAGLDRNPVFALDLPEDMLLRLSVRDQLPLEKALIGTQVHLRLDPETLRWRCSAGGIPMPARWLPGDCLPEGTWTAIEWMIVLLFACALLFVVGALLLLHTHPLLAPLNRDPGALLRLPFADLKSVDRALAWLRRNDAMLRAAQIDSKDWSEALGYQQASPAQRARLLSLRIAAHSKASTGWSLPGQVHEWRLPADLPLGLDRCYAYFPDHHVSAKDLVRHLRALPAAHDVILIFAGNVAMEKELSALAADRVNLFVCIPSAKQSEWLLSPRPQQVLLAALAQQLSVARISPYQTRGGVSRPSGFFGREQLLTRVINREPRNYLLVGGRQLGKTSLMKAIERRYVDHPQVRCRYLSLRDHQLAPRLAIEFDLPPETELDQVINALAQRSGEQRLLLLIDEADLFVREDVSQGCPQLSTLRALSEEGGCHFMIAGFWDLYEAVAEDYLSPLRNFGEVLTIGALEPQACRDLASVPLRLLRIEFEDEELVARLVRESGQRANLVAILCQDCLERMPPGSRVIRSEQFDAAAQSQAVLDALTGWARLSQDAGDCQLDRLIVYRVAQMGSVQMAAIVEWLERADVQSSIESIRRAFARLQLAFVLKREGDAYAFAVPLFSRQFEPDELELFVGQELKQMRAN